MQTLIERPSIKPRPAELRISAAPLAPRLPDRAGRDAGHRIPGLALAMGKQALLKIAGCVAGFGSILSGTPMSERGMFRYASMVQKQIAMAAAWPNCPLRGVR